MNKDASALDRIDCRPFTIVNDDGQSATPTVNFPSAVGR